MTTKALTPRMGDQVHFFDPKITGRVGWNNGFRGRGNGPYLALVTNVPGKGQELDLALFMPQAGGGVQFVIDVKGPEGERNWDTPHWDWTDPLQKARAAKRAEADEKERAEAEAQAALA